MQSIHHHFDQLTEDEQEIVGDAYNELAEQLSTAGLRIAGDDRAEIVVDAIARGILDTRKN